MKIKKPKPIGKKTRLVLVLGAEAEQPYHEKAMALPFKPGTVNHVIVSHDDWCDRLKGGICKCNQEVSAQLGIDLAQSQAPGQKKRALHKFQRIMNRRSNRARVCL